MAYYTRDVLPATAFTLPARYYTDPLVFAREMDLYRRMWIGVGRLEEIPTTGSYVTRTTASTTPPTRSPPWSRPAGPARAGDRPLGQFFQHDRGPAGRHRGRLTILPGSSASRLTRLWRRSARESWRNPVEPDHLVEGHSLELCRRIGRGVGRGGPGRGGQRGDQLGRAGRAQAGRRSGGADRAGGLAGPRVAFGLILERINAKGLRRATKEIRRPIRAAEWVMSAALSFGHGANDAQKSMGVVAALLLATGHIDSLTVPLGVKVICGGSATRHGAWRVANRPHDRPADLPAGGDRRLLQSERLDRRDPPATYLGGPVSTTQVVASSVVGVGGGRRRWAHVRWTVVRSIAFAAPHLRPRRRWGRLRWSCGERSDETWTLVPSRGTRRAGNAAPPDRDHGRRDGRAGRLGGGRSRCE